MIRVRQAGNFTMKSPWTVKYFMVATFVVDYENQRTEGNGIFYWLDDRPNAKLEGFFDLGSYCNAKYLTTNKEGFMGNHDEEHRYLRLQRCPDCSADDIKAKHPCPDHPVLRDPRHPRGKWQDLRVRASKKDRDKCKELRLFQSMVIERIRESNAWCAASFTHDARTHRTQ